MLEVMSLLKMVLFFGYENGKFGEIRNSPARANDGSTAFLAEPFVRAEQRLGKKSWTPRPRGLISRHIS